MKTHKAKERSTRVSTEAVAGKMVRMLKQHGAATVDAEGNNPFSTRLEVKPEEEKFLKRTPTRREREQRMELHQLASSALTLSGDLRPTWCEALETLKGFGDGKKDFTDLIIARRSIEPTFGGIGIFIGPKARCSNAAAALACYHACNPDLNAAIEQTKYFHARTLECVNRNNAERK